MTTAAKMIEQVRTAVTGVSARDFPDSAAPGTLRLGRQAHMYVSHAAGWRAANGRPLTALFGVPIDPDGEGCNWSLLNRAGAVIAEGEVTGT